MPFSKCLRAKIYSNMNVYFDQLGCQTLLIKESDPLLFSLGSWTNSKGATSKNPLKEYTIKTLRIVTSQINTAIVLKMEQFSVILQQWNKKMQMEWDMTQQYDQGLHYLLRPICPNTYDFMVIWCP